MISLKSPDNRGRLCASVRLCVCINCFNRLLLLQQNVAHATISSNELSWAELNCVRWVVYLFIPRRCLWWHNSTTSSTTNQRHQQQQQQSSSCCHVHNNTTEYMPCLALPVVVIVIVAVYSSYSSSCAWLVTHFFHSFSGCVCVSFNKFLCCHYSYCHHLFSLVPLSGASLVLYGCWFSYGLGCLQVMEMSFRIFWRTVRGERRMMLPFHGLKRLYVFV